MRSTRTTIAPVALPELTAIAATVILLNGTRVVVIGAGFAGLAAATDLKKLGAEGLIVEAHARIAWRASSDA